MSTMISIDFGNSYTKVGIRFKEEADAVLLKDHSLRLQEGEFCVPTLASRMIRNGREEWQFGTQVAEQQANLAGLEVFRNWKPRFFEGIKSRPLITKVRSIVNAVSSDQAVSQHVAGISTDLIHVLRTSYGHLPEEKLTQAVSDLLHSLSITSNHEPRKEETDLDMKFIGKSFFQWLRDELVEPMCQKHGLGPVSRIPARITIPSFGIAATKAELLMKEILEESGWCLDASAPVLAEPLANAIGAFTEGRNAIAKHRHVPLYSKMFKNTGLLKRFQDYFHGHSESRYCWTLLVDVGGYTTDFAMIGIDLDGIEARVDGEVDGKPQLAHESIPEGISNSLDPRIRALLPEVKQRDFDDLLRDPDQRRLETFHRHVYGSIFKQYILKKTKIGVGKEKELIQNCIQEFAEEVAGRAEEFLQTHQYDHIDDVILTGGGCTIFAIRKALYSKLRQYGTQKHHMFWEDDRPTENDFHLDELHKLQVEMARGATALGGASVYFDFTE